jgi:outer membrane protein assembly factor BamA
VFGGVDYWRLSDDYAQYWTLRQNEDEERKHVLSFGARAGMIEGHDKTGDAGLPVDLKYFAGGASTIRGFAYHSVSPREGNTAVGGRVILLTNLEYSYPIYEEILRGAVFVDRGTVATHVKDSHLLDGFRSAYGFGLRIQLPISPLPVSLDLAFPMEEKAGDSSRVFTFNFGTVF